jgi:FKBP-type peptidyl-prolyl cis-trans isomerase (trigger factor)
MAGDELDQFVNEMLDAKKLSGMSDDVRSQLVSDLKQRLLDQINKALIDALPDDKMDAFEQLLDDETIDDARVQQFILEAGVDVRKVTTVTMLRFYDMYVAPSSGGEVA